MINSHLFFVSSMHLNVYFCTVALSRQLQGVCNPLAHEPLNRIWNHPASLITVIWKFTTFIKVYMILYRNYKIFTVGLLFSSMARSLNDDNFHRPVLKPCECTFIYLKRDFACCIRKSCAFWKFHMGTRVSTRQLRLFCSNGLDEHEVAAILGR